MKTKAAVSFFIILLLVACNPPPVENPYRKTGIFPGGVNVPVVFLTSEWAGQPRIMASGWLVEGANGVIFSAKHFTDAFTGDVVELGGSECKAFVWDRIYDCEIVQVPPLRDAVILKLVGANMADLPKPYKIGSIKNLKVGDKVFVQGLHPHPRFITESNMKEGLRDRLIPIFRDFYEFRTFDPDEQSEISFDNLEAKIVSFKEHINLDESHDPLAKIRHDVNEYVKVITDRNHKFSFGGLSGGVVIRINEQGEPEAIGIVTAESVVRFEPDKDGRLSPGYVHPVSDTILITPIDSVKELSGYARTIK